MNRLYFKSSLSGSLFIVYFIIFSQLLYGQNDKINWVTWEEVQTLMQKEKRKVFVDIYTDWCGWCKRMDATTFRDPRIVSYINKNYYAIKFNAEYPHDIVFKSKPYRFIQQGKHGVHTLAIEITNGQLTYPTLVFIDEEFNTIQPVPGFQDADTFEVITNFFGGNHYKTTPYRVFEDNFKK